MVQPFFPGVGTQSRIADVIQRDNELSLRQEALNRQSGQAFLGLGAELGLGIAGTVEQAQRAAQQRELVAREANLDRIARGEVSTAQIAGRADVAGIGATSAELIARNRELGLDTRQGVEQTFLGEESGFERAARQRLQILKSDFDIGIEESRREGALEVAEEGTLGRVLAQKVGGALAAEEGVLNREQALKEIEARGREARALQEVAQAGSVALQGMQDLAANQRLILTLDNRMDVAVTNNNLALVGQLQAERARLVEIDAQRGADVARFAAQFLLEDTARGDPVRRMEDRAFIAEDTNRQGEATGTLAPGTAAPKTAAEIEQMVLDDPETAALSEIMRPHLQRALNRQAGEQDATLPSAQRAAERRERAPFIEQPADFIEPGVLGPAVPGAPAVPDSLGPFIGPGTGNVGLGPSAEGRRREALDTERLNPLTGISTPLTERERSRRIAGNLFGVPQRSALPGRVRTAGPVGALRRAGVGALDFLQGTLGLNPDQSTARNFGPQVRAASPDARIFVQDGELFIILPGGQIVPIPEAGPPDVDPRTGFRGQQFRGR
jgi:hypothetical protein